MYCSWLGVAFCTQSTVQVTELAIAMTLQGEPWTAALAGHSVDPLKQQEEQQRLMLERFQQEVSSHHHCWHMTC